MQCIFCMHIGFYIISVTGLKSMNKYDMYCIVFQTICIGVIQTRDTGDKKHFKLLGVHFLHFSLSFPC